MAQDNRGVSQAHSWAPPACCVLPRGPRPRLSRNLGAQDAETGPEKMESVRLPEPPRGGGSRLWRVPTRGEAPAGSQGISRGAAADSDSFLSPFLPSSTAAVFPVAVGSGLRPPRLPAAWSACRQPCSHPTPPGCSLLGLPHPPALQPFRNPSHASLRRLKIVFHPTYHVHFPASPSLRGDRSLLIPP